MDLEKEDAEEAGVDLPDQKFWNVEHMEERGTCQKNVLNPNAFCATKKGI